jgi:hypothetical protein
MRSELDTRVDASWLGLRAAIDSRDTVSRLVVCRRLPGSGDVPDPAADPLRRIAVGRGTTRC